MLDPGGVNVDAEVWETGPRFIESDRPLARYLGRPVAEFLRVEAASGVLLLLAAVVAMWWANSQWSGSYEALWQTRVGFNAGSFSMVQDLQGWINDGLMVFFFFVVGLEIKYEIVAGHLRDPKAASVPIIAAFGGMLVPALIYTAIVGGGAAASGWGIPMATDIAFAVGVLGLLGRRIPAPARIFLLTLAIADDVGAIAVIAVFYTSDLSFLWLAIAGLVFLGIVLLRRVRVWSMQVYAVVGFVAWFATYQSGVHATVAGVALGLLTPARPLLQESVTRRHVRQALEDDNISADELDRLRFLIRESVPVVARLQTALHPFASYVVLPIFALANAGVHLGDGVLGEALGSKVTMGVGVGLLFGKPIGIAAASWIAVKIGIGRLPRDTSWTMMVGLGIVGGVGFTVALFITGLSFPGNQQLTTDAKAGILAASILAGLIGALFLLFATRASARPRQPARSSSMVEERL